MESRYDQDPASGVRWEIHGPAGDAQTVEAWADAYVPFEPTTSWQMDLRGEIRTRCGLLDPSTDQVLNAGFFGVKPVNADVENLLLYNIDSGFTSFKQAGHNGIRFEYLGEVPPPAHGGAMYSYCYRYALAPRRRTVASFDCDWIELGEFSGEKKLAQVWLALVRGFSDGKVRVFPPVIEPETTFAVNVEIRSPMREKQTLGKLVKPIVDGVICAFHAHADAAGLPNVVEVLAGYLPAEAIEIEKHLLDERRAVLGVVDRLVAPYRNGVKRYPSDNLCMIGELLAAEAKPDDVGWAIKGRIVTL